jgi:hypothetical protein
MALLWLNAETTGYVSRFWFCAVFLRWGFVRMRVCVLFSGLARGLWVTLGDLVMEGRRMACGLIHGFPPALRDVGSQECANDLVFTVIIHATSGPFRIKH